MLSNPQLKLLRCLIQHAWQSLQHTTKLECSLEADCSQRRGLRVASQISSISFHLCTSAESWFALPTQPLSVATA